MKVKRYEAATLQEALMNVKRELGADAVILHTRKYNTGGMLGFFRRNMVEVLAAQEMPAITTNAKNAPQPAAAVSAPAAGKVSNNGKNSIDDSEPLRKEIQELKQIIKSMALKDKAGKESDLAPYPSIFGEIYLKLLDNGVEDFIAQDIIQSLGESIEEEKQEDEEIVYAALGRQLRRLLKVSGAIDLSRRGPVRTVAMIGPTGVGKTTTTAKLATIFSLAKRKKVGIITCDTFRIAAVEQIKVYGDILNVPVRVAYNREDMKHAMDNFADRDLIIIDTAGRSHWDTEKIAELRNLLAVCYPLEVNLVLGANIRYKDMLDTARQFRPFAFNHLIFTKLDETSTYGSLINMIIKCNAGVAYLCYGQNVPGEIQEAKVETLLGLTMGDPLSKVVKMDKES